MTQTHTPGPYVIWDDRYTVGFNDDNFPVAILEIVDHGDRATPALLAADTRFVHAAMSSYDKHCGPNAIACAEGDLLGEALAALSECVDFHGDDESPELDWPHLRRARAVLLKAKGEA